MNKIHLKFKLRTDRANANDTYPIYLYANINREVRYFTLNRLIPKNAWNEKRQEVRSSYPEWNLINDDISRYRTKAEEMRIASDKEDEMISMHQFERIFRGGVKDLIDILLISKTILSSLEIPMHTPQLRCTRASRGNLKSLAIN